MSVTILSPGPLTTIQDQGRLLARTFGWSQSGAMVPWYALLANQLVQNPLSTPVLEFAYKGPTLAFEEDAIVSVVWQEGSLRHNKQPCVSLQSIQIQAGDVLDVGVVTKGVYGYVAIQGLWLSDVLYGSSSSHTACGLASSIGRPFSKDEKVPVRSTNTHVRKVQLSSHWVTSQYVAPIRYVTEGSTEKLTSSLQKVFQSTMYKISASTNRMGTRLEGDPLWRKAHALRTQGVIEGSIQLPPNGQPIILGQDAQVTGGYPLLGVVASVDRPRLAQIRIGQSCSFERISVTSVQEAYREQHQRKQMAIQRLEGLQKGEISL